MCLVHGSLVVRGAGDSNADSKIWLYVTRQPKETDDVVQSKYFDLVCDLYLGASFPYVCSVKEIALVDRYGHIMRDVVNKLQLQVLLLYEDLSWVDRQDLLEVDPKFPPVIDREGYFPVHFFASVFAVVI